MKPLADQLLDTSSAVSRSRVRRGAEELVRWARYLDPEDRRLIVQVFQQGQPICGLAPVWGTRESVLRGRVDRLRDRMRTKEFRVVAECLDLFPEPYRLVAELRYLRGRSLAAVVAETGLTLHQVRERLGAVDALIRVGRALMTANAVSKLPEVFGDVEDAESGVA